MRSSACPLCGCSTSISEVEQRWSRSGVLVQPSDTCSTSTFPIGKWCWWWSTRAAKWWSKCLVVQEWSVATSWGFVLPASRNHERSGPAVFVRTVLGREHTVVEPRF